MGRRRDRGLAADAALDPPVEQAQGRLGSTHGLSGHPQGNRNPVLRFPGAALLFGLVALVLSWADAQPTGEVLLRREVIDIDAKLSKNDQGRSHVDSFDLR